MTTVSNSSTAKVVTLESYLNVVFKIRNTVSASTMTGVIDITLYLPKSVTNWDFSVAVSAKPVVVLIAIKTLPYSGVLTTPRLESNEPLSPPNTWIDCAFG